MVCGYPGCMLCSAKGADTKGFFHPFAVGIYIYIYIVKKNARRREMNGYVCIFAEPSSLS